VDDRYRRWGGTKAVGGYHVENAIRPSYIGMKNGLSIGNPDAGQRSASSTR
jgi:hypothetical protein